MSESQTSERPLSVFVPLAVGLLAMLIWAGFQTIQMVRERGNMKQVYANQEAPLQAAYKVRKQIDAIAAGMLKLANQGNDNAKMIIKALASRGISIDPDTKSSVPPGMAGDPANP